MNDVYILGISAFYHNSAAALIKNGKIVAASEEERFTRIKGDSSFPINSIMFCLEKENIDFSSVEKVVYYEDSSRKFGRILTTIMLNSPFSVTQFFESMPVWLGEKLWIRRKILKELNIESRKLVFLPHHLSHAASAYYPSPFNEAAVLTVDGVGEWTTASYGICKESNITLLKEMQFPNSIGLLYSAFTLYTGFKINNGEYKMMGLAPYGEPKYAQLIKTKLIKIGEDGSVVLNQKYFGYTRSLNTINSKFEELFGKPKRKPESEIEPFYADIAASIQVVTDEIILKIAKHIQVETKMKNIVLAGGVALNITAMGKLRASGIFENIWIQPAAGDSGASVGAALYVYYQEKKAEKKINSEDIMKNSFLGYNIEDSNAQDDKELEALGGVWTKLSSKELPEKIAQLISEGKVVAVARKRAEFGPRALGNRSILADARREDMLRHLNLSIKFREGFRPFAPAVIEEDCQKYFDFSGKSPYMLFAVPVKEERRVPSEKTENILKNAVAVRSDIPAVTHIDYSARVQTVNKNDCPFFYDILKSFKEKTGCSVVINTSFNVRSEPIVNTAVDAYKCFMKSGIDFAVIGNRLFEKSKQKGDEKNA
ncbi:MAG: carbamoyltransferase [Clostridia bacterium]|nr:carbamoyltransferase [Clostridia bacterium]